MRIGMILDNEFTGDPRVENEVLSLQKAGHEVFVLCLNYGEKKAIEDFHGTQVIRNNINLTFKKKLVGLNNTIFNFYPIYWKNKIISFVQDHQIQKLHIHDLWLLEGALKANRILKLPLIADLHENFVFALKHYKYANTFPGNILISQKKWENSEKKWLDQVDQIIVVIEEAKERLIKLGISAKKISVVANYVNIAQFANDESSLTSRLIEKYSRNKTLVYTGGFDVHRGLDFVIRATKIVKEEIPEFKLVLVGGGIIENDLKQLVKELGIESQVDFAGYRPHKELSSYIKMADACIIPHLKTEHTDNTIPHKLFQYMIYAKPVVTSNCAPLERIVNEIKSGYVYQNDDPSSCAKAILSILKNDSSKKGELGKAAVENKYNWTETSKNLISLYQT